jgi:hypothetical protein
MPVAGLQCLVVRSCQFNWQLAIFVASIAQRRLASRANPGGFAQVLQRCAIALLRPTKLSNSLPAHHRECARHELSAAADLAAY